MAMRERRGSWLKAAAHATVVLIIAVALSAAVLYAVLYALIDILTPG
jgi:hypothetical protein